LKGRGKLFSCWKVLIFEQNKLVMLVIADDIVNSTKLSEQELSLEIAVFLHEKGLLSFGQARKLAGMGYFEFEKLLFDRQVPPGYKVEDLESDMITLREFRRK